MIGGHFRRGRSSTPPAPSPGSKTGAWSDATTQVDVWDAVVVPGAVSYSSTVLATANLNWYWHLADTSTTAAAAAGSVTGTYSGAYTQGVAGIPGNADGAVAFTSGKIDFGASADMTGAFSVELWFKRTRSGIDEYLFSGGTDQPNIYIYGPTDHVVVHDNNGAAKVESSIAVTGTGWHHLVFTRAGSAGTDCKLYIDGVDVSTAQTAWTTPAANGSSLYVGLGYDGTKPFAGTIDEVAVYTAALSSGTVSSHYSAGSTTSGGGTGIDVTANLQAAIDAAPNGSTLRLLNDIAITSTINITNRSNLTINFNTFKLTQATAFPMIAVTGGSGITLSGVNLQGAHPNPGRWAFPDEHNHGISLYGTTGCSITGGSFGIQNVKGDGIYVAGNGDLPTDGLTVSSLTITGNGRMGIGFVHGRNATFTTVSYVNIAYRGIDIEPDWNTYSQQAVNVVFDGGSTTGTMLVHADGTVEGTSPIFVGTPYTNPGGGKLAPTINGVTVKNHSVNVTSPTPHWFIAGDLRDYRVANISMLSNTATQAWGGGMTIARCDGLTVTNNTVSAPAPWLSQSLCTAVTQSGNG